MHCDLCGSNERLYLTEIEGTKLNVCKKCSSFGNIIEEKKPIQKKQKSKAQDIKETTEIMEMIVENYSELIKKSRESMNLKQEELARKIAEKESVIHKLESGNIEPNIRLAKKLEKVLNINLIQEEKIEKISQNSNNDATNVTIGDLIKKNS